MVARSRDQPTKLKAVVDFIASTSIVVLQGLSKFSWAGRHER